MKRLEAISTVLNGEANEWDEDKMNKLDVVLFEMESAKLDIPRLGYTPIDVSILDIRTAVNYILHYGETAAEERRQRVIDNITAEVAAKFKECAQAMDDQGVGSLLIEVNKGLAPLGREIAQVLIDGREIRPDGLQDTKVIYMTDKKSGITIRQVGKAATVVTAGIFATSGLTQPAAAAERPNTIVASSVIDEGQEQTNGPTTIDTVDTSISQPSVAIEGEEQPTSAAVVDELSTEVYPTPDQADNSSTLVADWHNKIYRASITGNIYLPNGDEGEERLVELEPDVINAFSLLSEYSRKVQENDRRAIDELVRLYLESHKNQEGKVLTEEEIKKDLQAYFSLRFTSDKISDWDFNRKLAFYHLMQGASQIIDNKEPAILKLKIEARKSTLPTKPPKHANKTISLGSEANQERLAPHWDSRSLDKVAEYFTFYQKSASKYGVPWELIAVLHYRESALSRTNPANGQGIFQLYSTGETFAASAKTTDSEFQRQCDLAAKFVKAKSKIGQVQEKLKETGNSDAKIKDVLLSYNGRAEAYRKQAKAMGYTLHADGSPYVMNLADNKRDASKNPNWQQIITDHGDMEQANRQPGAFVLYRELQLLQKPAKSVDKPKHATSKTQSETNTGVKVPKALGNVVLYSQHDIAWWNYKYSIKKDKKAAAKQTMASSGCAPTAVAMVAATLTDKNITPVQVAGKIIKNGGRTLDNGTKRDAVIEALIDYGLGAKYVSKDAAAVKKGLMDGSLYIVAGKDSDPSTPLTSSGHYVVIRGVAKNGEFLINDPNSVKKSQKSWSAKELFTDNGAVIKVTK